MTPEEVRTVTRKLTAAMLDDNEGVSLGMGVALISGMALNLALIAEQLSHLPAPSNPETKS